MPKNNILDAKIVVGEEEGDSGYMITSILIREEYGCPSIDVETICPPQFLSSQEFSLASKFYLLFSGNKIPVSVNEVSHRLNDVSFISFKGYIDGGISEETKQHDRKQDVQLDKEIYNRCEILDI